MPSRPLGWRPDVHDPRDWTTADIVNNKSRLAGLAPVASPAKASLLTGKPSVLAFRGPRIFQVGESCVGFTGKKAIYISHRLQGVESPPMCSGVGNYTIARRQEHKLERPLPPLIDIGSRPRDMLNGLQGVGFVPESVWPDTTANLNRSLTPAATSAAYDMKGDALQWLRIIEVGTARTGAMREGLRRGWIPMFSILVDQPYLDHMGSDPIRTLNPREILGGHYQLALEVEDDGTVLADNWWPNWGFDDGMGRIGHELIESPYVSDIILLKSVPPWA